jgi:hypothetical protein
MSDFTIMEQKRLTVTHTYTIENISRHITKVGSFTLSMFISTLLYEILSKSR